MAPEAQKYHFYLDSVTSIARKRNTYEGDPPIFEDVSRFSLIFARCDRYKDFGPNAGRGLPALRGGLHCRLPPNAYSNVEMRIIVIVVVVVVVASKL